MAGSTAIVEEAGSRAGEPCPVSYDSWARGFGGDWSVCAASPAPPTSLGLEVWALRAPSLLFPRFCRLSVFPFTTLSGAFVWEILQCLGVLDTGTFVV